MMTTLGEDEVSDRTLVAAAQAGDGAAFLRLVARYRARLEATLRDVGDPARATDLAQDAIDAAYDEIADLRDPEGFYPWLRRIAINRLLKDIRQRGRRQAALDRLRPRRFVVLPLKARLVRHLFRTPQTWEARASGVVSLVALTVVTLRFVFARPAWPASDATSRGGDVGGNGDRARGRR